MEKLFKAIVSLGTGSMHEAVLRSKSGKASVVMRITTTENGSNLHIFMPDGSSPTEDNQIDLTLEDMDTMLGLAGLEPAKSNMTGEMHTLTIYNDTNYTSLSAACTDGAVYQTQVADLSGNFTSKTLGTAIDILAAALNCMGLTSNLVLVLTDSQNRLIDVMVRK